MVQQLAQRDIGGDIGRAFSQSLSEQLPKERQAQRLSQAFQQLQNQKPEQGKAPDISGFLGIPGGAEALQTLMPHLRPLLYAQSQQGTGQLEKGGLPMAQDEKELAPEKFFKTAEQLEKESSGFLQPPSAGDYFYDLKQKDYENQQANFQRGINVAERGISQLLHQNGLQDYSKLEGELLENMEAQMKILISKGMSPEAAFQTLKPELQNISRDLASLNGLNLKGAGVEGSIINAYERFKDRGLEHRFPYYAADIFKVPVSKINSIVSPPTNKQFNEMLKKIGKGGAIKEKIGTKPIDYNKIINTIKPEDNLSTMMQKMLETGLSVDQFVKDLVYSEKVKDLTDTQRDQLRDAPNYMDQLSSNWFDFTHKKPR